MATIHVNTDTMRQLAQAYLNWNNTLQSQMLPQLQSLIAQLEGDSPSPELGYQATRKLLAAGKPFTALFAFNDISAMGARAWWSVRTPMPPLPIIRYCRMVRLSSPILG